ncbi:MAG TPA: tRNA (guanine(26)-N(2))-dimethyltransferase [Methanosarcinaceae archaeon]|nr:tRNA (guanine(26)-N(2))-dimethyltransferase [Methanosarcinaceae archaeon]
MNTRTIIEGTTKVLVPIPPEGVSFPPSAAPVFYNPEMELNRDINVAATAAFVNRLVLILRSQRDDIVTTDVTYVDALSASGIRGIRIANELGISAVLNDWNEDSYNLIIKNIELNELPETTTASHKNANVLLHEKRFNIVDLDPFGTPAPFLDSAARSAVHLLEVTATDTAPLCGAHLNSGIRKYAAVPLNNEYHSEMGVRILLGKIARELAKHEKAMIPLLSHATRHYVRTYVQVKKGAKHADKTLKNMGFMSNCPDCGFRKPVFGLAVHIDKECPVCGTTTGIAGPLWLGQLHEVKFCDEVLLELEKRSLNTQKKAMGIITLCRDELKIPMFYDQHVICKRLGISASTIGSLISALKEHGYEASRTHFDGISFKTNAGITDIEKIMLSERSG